MTTKVIDKDALSAYQRWELPAVEGQLANPPLLTAKQLERISQQAYDEGYAQGQRDGFATGQSQVNERIAALNAAFAGLEEALKELDRDVEQELVQLAVAFARQIVRREIRLDTGHVVALVREAVAQLGIGVRHISVQAHPEDAALLREVLQPSATESHWRIVDDPSLHRGDCRIQSENARVDATIEARLATLAVAVLGGERRHDD